MSEAAIKFEIQTALTKLGFRWYRIQCGKWKVRGGWMHGAKSGTADLLVKVRLWGKHTRLLWIETKTEIGKAREAQEEFSQNLPSDECYLLARNLDDVLGWLKENEATA